MILSIKTNAKEELKVLILYLMNKHKITILL